MGNDHKPIRELGAPRCKVESHRLLALLLQKLEASAQQSNGAVSIDTIRQEIASLCTSTASNFSKVYRDCLVLLSDEVWEEKRQNALGRLLINDIEAHLTSQVNPDINSDKIPRRAIPPMLNLMSTLVGEPLFQNCYEEARHLRTKLQAEQGKLAVWQEFFAHKEAQRIKTQLLVALSRRFTDFDKRVNWVVQVMNSQLDHQVTVKELDGRPQWTLRPHHFYNMMDSLVAPMARFLSTEDGEAKMKEKFGVEGVEFLRLFIANLRERASSQ